MRRKILVLFDIGAVLMKLRYGDFYKEAAKHSPLDEREIERAYLESFLDDRANRGDITARQFFAELREKIQLSKELTEEALETIVAYKIPEEIREMVALKREIHDAGYAVGILSNIGEEAYKIIQRRYPEILALYDPRNPAIFSYRWKAMKPDPKVYDAIHGFDTVIFIDDKEKYLKVGIERGWKAIHYVEYPDETEPQRKSHSDEGYKNPNMKKAVSVAEVKKALREFGVEIH